jgi:hypothetical protein
MQIDDLSENITRGLIEKGNQQAIFLAISELCLKHRTFTEIENIYIITNNTNTLYTTTLIGNKSADTLYTHQSHTYLLSLR